MLSSDIMTEFRGRGDELRVYPLSFREFYNAYEGDKAAGVAGILRPMVGMPFVLRLKNHAAKSKYLAICLRISISKIS